MEGLKAVTEFIEQYWNPYLDLTESIETDSKTKLQEISQKKFKILPKYTLLTKKGPSHTPTFTISLKALNCKPIKTSAKSITRSREKGS